MATRPLYLRSESLAQLTAPAARGCMQRLIIARKGFSLNAFINELQLTTLLCS